MVLLPAEEADPLEGIIIFDPLAVQRLAQNQADYDML